jgi:hypothetical protein
VDFPQDYRRMGEDAKLLQKPRFCPGNTHHQVIFNGGCGVRKEQTACESMSCRNTVEIREK